MGLKLLTEETSLSTATKFGNATQVRVYAALTTIVRRYDTDGTTILGSCTMPAGSIGYFEKKPNEYIGATVAALATSVAYTHLD